MTENQNTQFISLKNKKRPGQEDFVSNYEITKIQTRELFLRYDPEVIRRKFGLQSDADYLYLNFIGRPYRVGKKDGVVDWQAADGSWHEGVFDDTMTIYDVLCDSKEDCHLSGTFCAVNSLKGIVRTGNMNVGSGLYDSYAKKLDHHVEELRQACLALGGSGETQVRVRADLSCRIPMFDFLPVILQFWESDDEFPASLSILFDENILSYMRYETTWYAMGHLLNRILEEMHLS